MPSPNERPGGAGSVEGSSLAKARARFKDVEEELEAAGVTSLADKMNDPEFLKADQALRHAERMTRMESGQRTKTERKDRHAGYQEAIAELEQQYRGEQRQKKEKDTTTINENLGELMGMEKARIAKEQESEALVKRMAELEKQMEGRQGVWDPEWLEMNEEKMNLEAKLREMDTGSPERPASVSPAPVEASKEPSEMSPADFVKRAEKRVQKAINEQKQIEKRRKGIESELARYGIDTPAKLQTELAEMSGENREGIPRGFLENLQHRARNIGRILYGKRSLENGTYVKTLLQSYIDLENESSANIRERRLANDILSATELAIGKKPRGRTMTLAETASLSHPQRFKGGGSLLEGMGKTFVEAPAGVIGTSRIQEELDALKRLEEGSISGQESRRQALREIVEEIEGYKMNLARASDEATYEDAQTYKDRLEDLHTRIRDLDEKVGTSPESIKALQEAESAYAEYRRMATRATEELQRGIREAAPGNQPMSVIGMREGRSGSYGTGREARRTVEASRARTANAEIQEKAEQMKARELVNKDIAMYRSEEWRKNLLDQINADEAWRKFMHGVYEDVVSRLRHLDRIGEGENVRGKLGSPDIALDYTLALFRANATKAVSGEYVYAEGDRTAAKGETARIDQFLLWGRRYKNVDENAEHQSKMQERIDQEAKASFEASLAEQPKAKEKSKVPKMSPEARVEYAALRHTFVQGAEKVDTDAETLYVRKDDLEKATLYPNGQVLVEYRGSNEQDLYSLKDYLAQKEVEASMVPETEAPKVVAPPKVEQQRRKAPRPMGEVLKAAQPPKPAEAPLPHVKRALSEQEQEAVEEAAPAQPVAQESRPILTLSQIMAAAKKKKEEEAAASQPAAQKKKKGKDYRQKAGISPQDELAEIMKPVMSKQAEERLAQQQARKGKKKGA